MPSKPHEIVRFWREQRGWSQAELAERSGIIQQEIAKIELGKRRLTADLMKKVAPALGIHPCDLLSDALPDEREQEQQLLITFRGLREAHLRSQALRVLQALGETVAGAATSGERKPQPQLVRGLHEDD